jgi:hypothetical protein
LYFGSTHPLILLRLLGIQALLLDGTTRTYGDVRT